jgi:hypothetical protein
VGAFVFTAHYIAQKSPWRKGIIAISISKPLLRTIPTCGAPLERKKKGRYIVVMETIDMGQGKRIELDVEADETRVILPAPASPHIEDNLARAGFKPDAERMRWVRDLTESTPLLAKQALRAAT